MMPFFLGYFAVTTALGGNTNVGLVVGTVMGTTTPAECKAWVHLMKRDSLKEQHFEHQIERRKCCLTDAGRGG